jgi:hypothetical protein
VLLDGRQADHQGLGDASVRLPLGHRRHDFELPRAELPDGAALLAAPEHHRHDLGIDCAASSGHALRGFHELLDSADTFLQEVSDALRAIGHQLSDVALLVVLRQNEHRRVGPLPAHLDRRP